MVAVVAEEKLVVVCLVLWLALNQVMDRQNAAVASAARGAATVRLSVEEFVCVCHQCVLRSLTVRLTRAARSHDTPERGHTGHARAGPVRRVQPNVIPLVERGFLTDGRHDYSSEVRFTTGRARLSRTTPAPGPSMAPSTAMPTCSL